MSKKKIKKNILGLKTERLGDKAYAITPITKYVWQRD